MNNNTKNAVFQRLVQQQMLSAFLAGDTAAADAVMTQVTARKMPWEHIYLRLLMPAMREVGRLWCLGKVSVAQEHMATQLCLDLMSQIRARTKRSSPHNIRAVISCVESNQHVVGARAVADFLTIDGWSVDFLGADIPAHDLQLHVKKIQPALVGLSIVLDEHVAKLAQAIGSLRALEHPPKILVGGPKEILSAKTMANIQADGFATDALDALNVARELVRLPHSRVSVDQYLRELGKRIAERRKNLAMSQQALAAQANLDRTYLSTVEHGKQNVTISVIAKLAVALEMSLEELLVEPISL
jgi:methanogenic corrinoid protein MtbC1/DNA-binding XRE family transcriptional regulator